MPGQAANLPSPIADMHVHSACSADGESSILDYARRAEFLGLAQVGICEHVDFDPRDQDCGFLDRAAYDREIMTAREAVPHIQLHQGVEIAYQDRREGESRHWLAASNWDFVVLSVHLLDYADDWAIVSEPVTTASYFATHTQRQSYLPYFKELLCAAQSGLGDVLGHFDLVKRYGIAHFGPFKPADFQDEICSVLRAAVEAGVGLEINTSGLRQAPGEPYPALDIVRWYRQLGGEILTIGSDAHRAADLAAGVAQAQEMARTAGFRALASFQQRQVCWIDL